jgi:hypothetical protein
MRLPIAQIQWKGFRVNSLAPDYVLDIWPEPGWDHGRKAREMSDLWTGQLAGRAHGVLWMDPDIAADPDDLAAMQQAVSGSTGAMLTGLVKLWPQSTSRHDWIWSHRGGTIGFPAATQDETAPVSYISLGFLWTPSRLLDLAFPAGRNWRWEQVDVGLSELALSHGIPAATVPECRPKHLHYRKEHEP